MTKYRYDQLAFSSVTANFINETSPTGSIACSGTIANDSGANFSTTITIPSVQFSNIFLTNQNTGNKSYANNNYSMDAIWQYVSQETVQISTTFSGTSVTVEISVSNFTGSTITLTSQTYTVLVIVYNLPF